MTAICVIQNKNYKALHEPLPLSISFHFSHHLSHSVPAPLASCYSVNIEDILTAFVLAVPSV